MRFNTCEWMIAWRFLVHGKAQTVLIILGIALGVAVQVFLISLIAGLQKDIVQRTVGSSPHITVAPPVSSPRPLGSQESAFSDFPKPLKTEEREILSWQQYQEALVKRADITASAPVANGSGYIEKGNASFSVLIKGVTVPDADKIYKFDKSLLAGKFQPGGNNVAIGKVTSEKSGLGVGDKFFLRNQKGRGDYFIVQGVYDLGSSAANNMVVMSLDRARNFLDMTGVSAIEVQVRDVFAAEELAREFGQGLSRVRVESWQEKNKELLNALRSQSSSSAIIQFFVLLSITLGISSVLAITAIQKSRQLGILKAMGVNNQSAARIFIIQGFAMGSTGAFIGILMGLGLAGLFLFASKSAGGPAFDLELTVANLLLPAVLAVVSASVAALVPARRAAALNPMEVIRNG